MSLETTLLWICIASTVALVIQVILLTTMLVSALRIRRQLTDLVATIHPVIDRIGPIADMSLRISDLIAKATPVVEKLGPIADTSQRILEDVRKYADQISTKANDMLDLGQKQLVRVDGVMAEAAARTRSQMDRIEMVMDDTVNRFQETTSLLQNGIVKPLRQLNAVTAGVRAALSFLAQGRRTTVEQATHDEEMFI